MLAELTIIPVGDPHSSDELAHALDIIDDSGLPYQLTPTATCIEGSWDEVMEVIRKCHQRVKEHSPHLMTMIKIEDDGGESDKLTRNVSAVAEKMERGPIDRP